MKALCVLLAGGLIATINASPSRVVLQTNSTTSHSILVGMFSTAISSFVTGSEVSAASDGTLATSGGSLLITASAPFLNNSIGSSVLHHGPTPAPVVTQLNVTSNIGANGPPTTSNFGPTPSFTVSGLNSSTMSTPSVTNFSSTLINNSTDSISTRLGPSSNAFNTTTGSVTSGVPQPGQTSTVLTTVEIPTWLPIVTTVTAIGGPTITTVWTLATVVPSLRTFSWHGSLTTATAFPSITQSSLQGPFPSLTTPAPSSTSDITYDLTWTSTTTTVSGTPIIFPMVSGDQIWPPLTFYPSFILIPTGTEASSSRQALQTGFLNILPKIQNWIDDNSIDISPIIGAIEGLEHQSEGLLSGIVGGLGGALPHLGGGGGGGGGGCSHSLLSVVGCALNAATKVTSGITGGAVDVVKGVFPDLKKLIDEIPTISVTGDENGGDGGGDDGDQPSDSPTSNEASSTTASSSSEPSSSDSSTATTESSSSSDASSSTSASSSQGSSSSTSFTSSSTESCTQTITATDAYVTCSPSNTGPGATEFTTICRTSTHIISGCTVTPTSTTTTIEPCSSATTVTDEYVTCSPTVTGAASIITTYVCRSSSSVVSGCSVSGTTTTTSLAACPTGWQYLPEGRTCAPLCSLSQCPQCEDGQTADEPEVLQWLKSLTWADIETAGNNDPDPDPDNLSGISRVWATPAGESLQAYMDFMNEQYNDPATIKVRHGQDVNSLHGSSAEFRVFRDEPMTMALRGLWGCTSVVVLSEAAVWVSHIWERPTFELEKEEFEAAVAELYTGSDPIWLPVGLESVTEGTRPDTRYGQVPFDPLKYKVKVIIITPGSRNAENEMETKHPEKVEYLRSYLEEKYFKNEPHPAGGLSLVRYVPLTALLPRDWFSNARYVATWLENRPQGRVLIQYDPKQKVCDEGKPIAGVAVRVDIINHGAPVYATYWPALPQQQRSPFDMPPAGGAAWAVEDDLACNISFSTTASLLSSTDTQSTTLLAQSTDSSSVSTQSMNALSVLQMTSTSLNPQSSSPSSMPTASMNALSVLQVTSTSLTSSSEAQSTSSSNSITSSPTSTAPTPTPSCRLHLQESIFDLNKPAGWIAIRVDIYDQTGRLINNYTFLPEPYGPKYTFASGLMVSALPWSGSDWHITMWPGFQDGEPIGLPGSGSSTEFDPKQAFNYDVGFRWGNIFFDTRSNDSRALPYCSVGNWAVSHDILDFLAHPPTRNLDCWGPCSPPDDWRIMRD